MEVEDVRDMIDLISLNGHTNIHVSTEKEEYQDLTDCRVHGEMMLGQWRNRMIAIDTLAILVIVAGE